MISPPCHRPARLLARVDRSAYRHVVLSRGANPNTARDAEAAAPGDGAHTGECRVGHGKPPVHSRFRPLRGAAAIGFVSQFRPRPSDPTSAQSPFLRNEAI